MRWFLGVSLEILVSPLESLPVWRGCSSLSGDLRSLFLRPREAVSHGLGLSVARDERVVIPVPPQRSWSLLPGNSVDFLFIHKLPRISLDILTYWSFKNVPWLALEPFDLGVS